MNPLDKVKEQLKRLETLIDRSAVSVAIQTIVPDAFDNGNARVRFTSRFPHKERQDFTVTINDKYVFEATKVPDVLWNDHVARKQRQQQNKSNNTNES
jgi:hypothetical protein